MPNKAAKVRKRNKILKSKSIAEYKSKKYLKDRSALFAKSGNGWWVLQGTYLGKTIGND